MIEAKLYYKQWWWKYYRTADGRTFSVREDFKKVFYHGNVKREKKKSCYPIFIKNVEKLRRFVNFVD